MTQVIGRPSLGFEDPARAFERTHGHASEWMQRDNLHALAKFGMEGISINGRPANQFAADETFADDLARNNSVLNLGTEAGNRHLQQHSVTERTVGIDHDKNYTIKLRSGGHKPRRNF